uniref:CSON015403 protein n=1 Tax=Culicoides sonorensis TaxID=179676 RepID=A0A336LNP9_CULSO
MEEKIIKECYESERSDEEDDFEQFHEPKYDHTCHYCNRQFKISKLLFQHQVQEHKGKKISKFLENLLENEVFYSSDSDCDYTISVNVLKTPKPKTEYLSNLQEYNESFHQQIHADDENKYENLEYIVEDPGGESTKTIKNITNIGKEEGIDDFVMINTTDRIACYYCTQTFTTPKILKQHIKLYHVQETGTIELDLSKMTVFTCPECLRELKDGRCLKKHMKLCHNLVVHSTHRRPPPIRVPSKEPAVVRGQLCDEFPIIRDRSPNSGKPRTKCGLCGHGPVYGYTTIMKHQIRKHGRPKKETGEIFICDFCSKEFFSKENLSRHLKIHENARRYQCDMCESKFNTALLLTRHKRLHVYIKCGYCEEEFQFRSKYKNHHRTHHSKLPKNVRMIQQGKNNEIIMTNDIPKINNEEYMEVCMGCNKAFRSKRGFKEHQCKGLDNFGSNDGEVICTVRNCNFSADDPTILYDHKCTEHSNIIYTTEMVNSRKIGEESCSVCLKSFKSKKGLLNHRCKEPRHVVCPLDSCGSKFDTLRDYYVHVELVHSESNNEKNPVLVYQIDETEDAMQLHDVVEVESEIVIGS